MSTTGRISRESDENVVVGAVDTGNEGKNSISRLGVSKQEEVRKQTSTVLGVPRKALSAVAVNSKKQQQCKQANAEASVTAASKLRLKRKMVYHDSEDEEEGSDGASTKDVQGGEADANDAHTAKKQRTEQCPSPAETTTMDTDVAPAPFPHKDLDSLEAEDVSMCVEYTNDIFAHLLQREKETTCKVNYVQDRDFPFYVRPSMRAILVDWLIEVHLKFQLLPEALYLAINIMDRYLSTNKVTLSKLQLVAITSLLIAAKFEEVNLPKLSNYVYITDNAYTMEEIKISECQILNSLDFNIGWPNPMNFLRRISKADNYNHSTRNLAKLFLEYAMCCPKFVNTLPSVLAAVSMHCAMEVNYGRDKMVWDETLEWYSSMATTSTDYDFKKLCKELINEFREPSTQLNALTYKFKKIGVWDTLKKWCDKQTDIE